MFLFMLPPKTENIFLIFKKFKYLVSFFFQHTDIYWNLLEHHLWTTQQEKENKRANEQS